MVHDVRKSEPTDQPGIFKRYPRAFPGENLIPLVASLLDDPASVLSLIALSASEITGHAACTFCKLEGQNRRVALLGPIAVDPDHQRQGVGQALVSDVFTRMAACDIDRIFVLGDPAYYQRFGFAPETGVEPPYPLPKEWRSAWQSRLLNGDDTSLSDRMAVPAPWRIPALWGL
ncbi:N-acetyltransferase [bacterium SCSIO 12827]|nr:N-acetyltransferase [bacterium SCSIO 12827]